MKRLIPALLIGLFCFGCASNANYKQIAVEYLKTKVSNAASVDTIQFFKPDSIYTTFHDTKEYRTLMLGLNNFYINADSANIKETEATIRQKEKTFKNVVVGWDVRLIYKAKDKKGMVKTDTCRFMFDSTLKIVKDLNGMDF
ncbi:hypothetical protein [Mucilaginibacter xinganensis]|uniref:Uncharacterized protein n=1 Tax=Mucilaginibacter xinganensis TaxID=1234841 RepID=A0A223NWM0_9SPHI|nr:hypothetical protein [Mucilaginibacter xinganensis]ASU34216.1 hypothetical protein MuYL_2327 [Mucilaginibacter xinganensis]